MKINSEEQKRSISISRVTPVGKEYDKENISDKRVMTPSLLYRLAQNYQKNSKSVSKVIDIRRNVLHELKSANKTNNEVESFYPFKAHNSKRNLAKKFLNNTMNAFDLNEILISNRKRRSSENQQKELKNKCSEIELSKLRVELNKWKSTSFDLIWICKELISEIKSNSAFDEVYTVKLSINNLLREFSAIESRIKDNQNWNQEFLSHVKNKKCIENEGLQEFFNSINNKWEKYHELYIEEKNKNTDLQQKLFASIENERILKEEKQILETRFKDLKKTRKENDSQFKIEIKNSVLKEITEKLKNDRLTTRVDQHSTLSTTFNENSRFLKDPQKNLKSLFAYKNNPKAVLKTEQSSILSDFDKAKGMPCLLSAPSKKKPLDVSHQELDKIKTSNLIPNSVENNQIDTNQNIEFMISQAQLIENLLFM